MFREYYDQLAHQAMQEEMSYSRYLYELALKECEVRRANKIQRLVKTSRLPLEKTLSTFELKRLPLKLRHQVKSLLEGSFVDRRENILAFGCKRRSKSAAPAGLKVWRLVRYYIPHRAGCQFILKFHCLPPLGEAKIIGPAYYLSFRQIFSVGFWLL